MTAIIQLIITYSMSFKGMTTWKPHSTNKVQLISCLGQNGVRNIKKGVEKTITKLSNNRDERKSDSNSNFPNNNNNDNNDKYNRDNVQIRSIQDRSASN